MNIVIIGQGAIGLLLYSFADKSLTANNYFRPLTAEKRSHGGVNINLSLRPSTRIQSKPKQLHVTEINGDNIHQSLHYATDEHIKQADILIFAVKSYQVNQAIEELIPLISSKAAIVLCHNGMGTFEALPNSIITDNTIMAMLTTYGCLRLAPFTIENTGIGDISLGLLNESEQSLTNITFIKALLPNVTYYENIKEKQWLKLAINCVINPLTALHNVKNGEIATTNFDKIKTEILEEFILVSKARGYEFDLDNLVKQVTNVALATKNNSSSMRCDVLNKQRTEIDFINGYIKKVGKAENIATPVNTMLWQKITSLL